jgi:hypothetical protein
MLLLILLPLGKAGITGIKELDNKYAGDSLASGGNGVEES